MKTIEDLKAIYASIIEAVRNNDHDIMEDEVTENRVYFEKDGWYTEIGYECEGKFSHSRGDRWTPEDNDLICAWGRVTDIEAVSHIDPATGEETDFEGVELDELRSLINKELENIY